MTKFLGVYPLNVKIQPIVDSNHPICPLVSFIMHEYTIKYQLNVCFIAFQEQKSNFHTP